MFEDNVRVSYGQQDGARQMGRWSQLRRDVGYVLVAFPLALTNFVLAVTLFSVGAALTLVWVGLPILVGAALTARGFAQVERWRLHRLTGAELPSGLYPPADEQASRMRRLFQPLRSTQYWLDAIWGIVGFVTSLISWCVVVVWVSLVLGGLTYWFWEGFLPETSGWTLSRVFGFSGRFGEILFNMLIGLVALATLPTVARWSAQLHAGIAHALLNGRAQLVEQVTKERGYKEAHQEAEATSLRRLERDIHDGPQQRLVRLGMDLARVKKQIQSDPERANQILDDALQQTREATEELRSLTRGIAPPLLVDRGLEAALREVTDRFDIPVPLVFDVAASLPAQVETSSYFLVSEALTNIAKHSAASQASVTVIEQDGCLTVTVWDNGLGGAHLAKGTGLAGLRARLAGVGAELVLESPVGGPTTVSAELPFRVVA